MDEACYHEAIQAIAGHSLRSGFLTSCGGGRRERVQDDGGEPTSLSRYAAWLRASCRSVQGARGGGVPVRQKIATPGEIPLGTTPDSPLEPSRSHGPRKNASGRGSADPGLPICLWRSDRVRAFAGSWRRRGAAAPGGTECPGDHARHGAGTPTRGAAGPHGALSVGQRTGRHIPRIRRLSPPARLRNARCGTQSAATTQVRHWCSRLARRVPRTRGAAFCDRRSKTHLTTPGDFPASPDAEACDSVTAVAPLATIRGGP